MANDAKYSESSFWLRVFSNSKVNGAPYWGDHLPAYNWSWPTGTYLQRRLNSLRLSAADLTTDAGVDIEPKQNDASHRGDRLEPQRTATLH